MTAYASSALLERPTLPELHSVFTAAKSSRHGVHVRLVWNHRWAGGTFGGVVAMFKDPANEASAHFVYAGEVGPDAGKCAQMIPLAEKAWTEFELNPSGVSIESADAIWLGHDPEGFSRLSRITAYLLHRLELPAAWIRHGAIASGHGYCRHADGGVAGGNHTRCPTTDLELWRQFGELVAHELHRGEFRKAWAR